MGTGAARKGHRFLSHSDLHLNPGSGPWELQFPTMGQAPLGGDRNETSCIKFPAQCLHLQAPAERGPRGAPLTLPAARPGDCMGRGIEYKSHSRSRSGSSQDSAHRSRWGPWGSGQKGGWQSHGRRACRDGSGILRLRAQALESKRLGA